MTTLQLSEIDYPPFWPDRHSLRVTASGCMLADASPGDMQVWIDDGRLLEAWFHDAEDEFAVWMRADRSAQHLEVLASRLRDADLGEAVDDLINLGAEPAHLLDWARHLEVLASRLREAANGS